MGEKKFKIYHWEFFIQNNEIYVYETRDGDVIGYIMNKCLPESLPKYLDEIQKTFVDNNMSEEEVYDWIDNQIEYL